MPAAFDTNVLRGIANPMGDIYENTLNRQRAEGNQRELDAQEVAARMDKIAGALYGATTPETWNRTIQMLKQEGVEFSPGEEDFRNRDAVLSQAMTLKEQIAQGNDIQKLALDEYNAHTSRINATKKGTGTNININTGNMPLAKPVQTDVQSKVVNSTELLSTLDKIKEAYDPEFLRYKGQIGAFATKIQDKAGITLDPKDKEFLQKRTKFVQQVERVFNAYRKEITGAAASVQELDRLKQSIINKDQGPAEFEAALETFQDELRRLVRLRTKFLREGIDPNSPDGGEQFDKEFLGNGDDDIQQRGDELLQELGDPNKVHERLVKEGYSQE